MLNKKRTDVVIEHEHGRPVDVEEPALQGEEEALVALEDAAQRVGVAVRRTEGGGLDDAGGGEAAEDLRGA